jgi:hypothetical protein
LMFLILLCILILNGCKLNRMEFLHENVPKCYCTDEEIHVYYRSPIYFKDKIFADTITKGYIKIYFPNIINDTLEIFINNKKIVNYFNDFHNDVEGHIFYDYSKDKKNPIITIRLTDNQNDCMQLLIDDRYRLMFVNKIEGIWYVMYSNFHIPSI